MNACFCSKLFKITNYTLSFAVFFADIIVQIKAEMNFLGFYCLVNLLPILGCFLFSYSLTNFFRPPVSANKLQISLPPDNIRTSERFCEKYIFETCKFQLSKSFPFHSVLGTQNVFQCTSGLFHVQIFLEFLKTEIQPIFCFENLVLARMRFFDHHFPFTKVENKTY